MSQEQVLVVDDEEVMRDVLGRVLTQAGYEVAFAENGAKGIEAARKGTFAAAIVDVMLPEMGGLEVLEELKKHDPELVVLMITAFASMEMAIDAIKKGAFYFVPKPFDNQQLLHILASGLLQRRLADENRQLRTALRDQGRFMELVGKSQRMLQVFQLVAQVAPSRSTILVAGESGTGKELVAKAIHQNSPRKRQAVRGGELRLAAARAARVEPVRARQGRLHRCRLRQEGPLRARRQGHALLRRDRQHPDRDAGEAAARDAGARVHAARRRRHDQGRRARGGGDQRRPAACRRGGALPRGPLLPPERDRDPAAALAPAQGGHPGARPALRRQVRAREQQGRRDRDTRGAAGADGLRLAGQRARARERDRARRGARDRPR